ncbi:MAG: HVO_0476 family zinc finger protein [Methanolinea sp.]|nr:HVO_0476 family zinc finger protein [Methanolinea sp.]
MGGEIETYCPECSCETVHEILAGGRNPVGRCTECGDVHPVSPGREKKKLLVKAIVSDGATSRPGTVGMEEGEVCRVGDTFVAECGDEYTGVEVTSIEAGGTRTRKARAEEISTLWTRKVEEVPLRIAVHAGKTTVPLRVTVPGEDEFAVGETYSFGKKRIRISRIKIRNGGMLKKSGEKAEAKRIRRIFGYPA